MLINARKTVSQLALLVPVCAGMSLALILGGCGASAEDKPTNTGTSSYNTGKMTIDDPAKARAARLPKNAAGQPGAPGAPAPTAP